jgi:hypothetical protein
VLESAAPAAYPTGFGQDPDEARIRDEQEESSFVTGIDLFVDGGTAQI